MKHASMAFALLAITGLVSACASSAPRGPSTKVINRVLATAPGEAQPSAIVAVEIAYRQSAEQKGQFAAGADYAAAGALLHARQGPLAYLSAGDALNQSGRTAQWEPRVVVMSCDGAMALSQGRYVDQDGIVGNYVTIWERQNQNEYEYKWIYDVAGPDVPQPPPRRQIEDGDIVVTAIDSIKGLVATCPRGNAPIPAPPAIPIGEDGASDAKLSRDGTMRWRWEHRPGGMKYVAAEYFYEGDWITAVEETLASPAER